MGFGVQAPSLKISGYAPDSRASRLPGKFQVQYNSIRICNCNELYQA